MKTKRFLVSVMLSSALAGFALNSQAATSALTTTVTKVLSDTEKYGGCMASLAISPTTKLAGCSANWVSFSCTGTFADKALAFANFENAKMALAMNKQVYVEFDDSKRHNNYCFARRVDVIK